MLYLINERPVQQSGRQKKDRDREGKKRQKIDIEFMSSEVAPRLRFSYEAKRLHDSSSVSAYVGPEGMGCFVNAEYAASDSCGGMLGFVQDRSIEVWSKNIERKMASSRKALKTFSDPIWIDTDYSVSGVGVKRSRHERSGMAPVEIFHRFLDFRSN